MCIAFYTCNGLKKRRCFIANPIPHLLQNISVGISMNRKSKWNLTGFNLLGQNINTLNKSNRKYISALYGFDDGAWVTDTISFSFGICPSSKMKKKTKFRKPALLPSSCKEAPTMMEPLEWDILSLGTIETFNLLRYVPDNR